ncbi:MAG: cell division protein SepF [Nanoarchaeota archaeon]|nr:cell division protein SepF [Nanoarchaeota archaeon]
MVFGFKKKNEENTPDYLEIDLDRDRPVDSKVVIKTFTLKTYEDVNPILNTLREGFTIAVIDIKILKSKDVVELKRVISKIKKTIEALDGTIAGFGENVVIATPSFARIQKGDIVEEKPKERLHDLDRF